MLKLLFAKYKFDQKLFKATICKKPVKMQTAEKSTLLFSQPFQHFRSFPPQLARPQIVHDGVEALAETQGQVRDHPEPVIEMAVFVRGRRCPYMVKLGRDVADHEGQNDQAELQVYFPVPPLDHGRTF